MRQSHLHPTHKGSWACLHQRAKAKTTKLDWLVDQRALETSPLQESNTMNLKDTLHTQPLLTLGNV